VGNSTASTMPASPTKPHISLSVFAYSQQIYNKALI